MQQMIFLAIQAQTKIMCLVLELLGDSRLDALIEPPVPFDSAPATYVRLDADPGASLHTVFAYDLQQPQV